MSETSEIRCPTPCCIEAIEKYGERYHRVYENDGARRAGGVARCEYCGGVFDGKTWIHRCATCEADVEPGELAGLFVPHACKPCVQKRADRDRASGNVCFKCREPRSLCCC